MVRVSIALALGIAAAAMLGITRGEWHYSPAVGWIVAATVYLVWTLAVVLPMNAEQTAAHVRHRYEDGTPRLSHLIIVIASVASLGGVGYLLAAETGRGSHHLGEALIGILSVVASWFAIHTTFMLRYAQLYFHDGRESIDFNSREGYRPCYIDFAYLAFTVGMTYQVSDTNIATRRMRRAVLAQALVSFMLGAVVLASTINLILALAS